MGSRRRRLAPAYQELRGALPPTARLPAGVALQLFVGDPAGGDIGKGVIEDGQAFICLCNGEAERWADLEDVGVQADIEDRQTKLGRPEADLGRLAGGWLLRCPVAHQLDSEGEAAAADITHEPVPIPQAA